MPKCSHETCKKMLSMTEQLTCKCKCGNTYCVKHRLAETHHCNYNFKNEIDAEDYIQKNKCDGNKLKIKL